MRDLASRSEPESAWLGQVASTTLEAPLPGFAAGVSLCGGRYVVERELGRGGMGIVYAAWDQERRETVALKTFTSASPTSIYRIKQEFRALAHVVHRNLVRLHELFEDQGRWCFTLEFVPGQTLLRALGPAPEQFVRQALEQLAAGISALHAAGKLHRDLKPSNVMLTPDGRVVILDFGLAEDIRSLRTGSITSGVSGTPGYMAPELNISGGASEASDWYSFGVIVWELLTGRLPFAVERVAEGREAWPTGSATTPCSISVSEPRARAIVRSEVLDSNEKIPTDLAELCRALLAADPGQRPNGSAIARALRGEALTADAVGDGELRGVASVRGFWGRARELSWVRQAFERCRRGGSLGVALLSGESGIGKTALVQTFLREVGDASRGALEPRSLILAGRCYEREFVPYKAFDAVVDDLCRYLAQLPLPERASLLPADFGALERLFPVLGYIRDSPRSAQLETEDVHELRRRGFDALVQLLERISETRSVVLWIDDLQWTDEDSTLLLLHLLRGARAPKIFLIASHRNNPGTGRGGLQPLYDALAGDVRLDVSALELGPLSHDDATALLESVSPRAPRALVERAQGHPFLLEELVCYAERQAGGSEVWPSLEEALGARIHALPEGERGIIELLALAGRPLSESIARAAFGPGWHSSVQALCGSRLARRDASTGNLSCYHDAIREVVVGAVSARSARRGHRALARALLVTADSHPEHLAQHLLGSGHPQRAAEQMAVAAQRAASGLAFERAAQLYENALELGRFAAPASRQLQVARAHALSAAGRGNVAAQLYLAVIDGSDPDQELELLTRAAEQYLLSGRLERGLELLRSALGSLGLRLHASTMGAIASFIYHQLRLRFRGYHFEARPVPEPIARKLLSLQRAMVALSRLDQLRACELASRVLLLALESGSAAAIGPGLVGDVIVGSLFRLSDAEFARRVQRAERACAEFGGPEERALLHSALATASRLAPQPDLPAALAHLEQFFAIHREHVLPRASYERPWEEWARAVVRCLGGGLGEVAREVPARLDEGWARGDHCIIPLWASGDPLLARLAVGDVAGAERDLARAEEVWSPRSFTLQDLMMVLGKFYLRRYHGDRRGAWRVAETAHARLATSPLRRMPNAVDVIASLRGHAALELAAETRHESERRELSRLVRKIYEAKLRHPHFASVFRSHVLAAAWHHHRRDDESAARALAEAEPRFAAIPLYAHAVRYRRGLLEGGEDGARRAAEGRQFFVAAGAVEPERLLDLMLPGYELP